MQKNMASKQACRANRVLHLYGVRAKNKSHKGAKYANESKSKILQQCIFGGSMILIIMASAIAEGGRFIPAAVFSVIGLAGLFFVAKEAKNESR